MDIDIKRSGSRPSTKGAAEWFTGAVRVDPLFQAPDPARVGGAHVTFEPSARTAWHTHYFRIWMGAKRRRPHRRNPARRRGVVSARPEALARGFADDGDEPYCDSGISERKSGDLDGKGERRAVPQVIWTAADGASTWNQS
jgi:hypothetical protein